MGGGGGGAGVNNNNIINNNNNINNNSNSSSSSVPEGGETAATGTALSPQRTEKSQFRLAMERKNLVVEGGDKTGAGSGGSGANFEAGEGRKKSIVFTIAEARGLERTILGGVKGLGLGGG